MQATTTPTPTQPQKSTSRSTKARTFRIVQRPTPDEVAIVRITVDGVPTDYHVNEFHVPSEMGLTGYEFGKGPSDEPYHVLFCHDGIAVCDCRGFVRHNRCKHSALTPILYRMFRRA